MSNGEARRTARTLTSGDPVYQLCLLLWAKVKWVPSKIATRLSVPVTIIEDCLRTKRSPPLLQRHVMKWIRESGEVPHQIPTALLASVFSTEDAGFHEQFLSDVADENHTALDATTTTTGVEEVNFGFTGMDKATREHFRYLQQSIGHNFISILNDPMMAQQDTAVGHSSGGWGEWFFGGNTSRTGGPGYSKGEAVIKDMQNMLPTPIAPITVPKDMFIHYAKSISEGYHNNQKCVALATQMEIARSNVVEAVVHQQPSGSSLNNMEGRTKSLFEDNLDFMDEEDNEREGKDQESLVASLKEELHHQSANSSNPVSASALCQDQVPMEYFSPSYTVQKLLKTLQVKHAGPPASSAAAPQGQQSTGGNGRNANNVLTPPSRTECNYTTEVSLLEALIDQVQSYEDTVECVLMAHVHRKTDQIFAASKLFNILQIDVEGAIEMLSNTREEVVSSGGCIAQNFMSIAKNYRRRKHLATLLSLFQEVDALHHQLQISGERIRKEKNGEKNEEILSGMVNDHVEKTKPSLTMTQGGFCESVDLIQALLSVDERNSSNQNVDCSHSSSEDVHSNNSSFNFNTVSSFNRLKQLHLFKCFQLQAKKLRQEMLNRVLTQSEKVLGPEHWGSGGASNESSVDWEAVDQVVKAAERLHCLQLCLEQYRQSIVDYVYHIVHEGLVNAMREVVLSGSGSRTISSSSSSPDIEGILQTNNAANNEGILSLLGKMKVPQFVTVLSKVLNHVAEYVQRSEIHTQTVYSLVSEGESPQQSSDQEEHERISNQHHRSIYHSVQVCVAQLFECREDSNSSMRFSDMESVMRTSFAFIVNLETMLNLPRVSLLQSTAVGSSKTILSFSPEERSESKAISSAGGVPPISKVNYVGPFRAILLSQAKTFFKKQHEKQQEKMLMVLSQEKWEPEENIEHVFQTYADKLCESDEESIQQARQLACDGSLSISTLSASETSSSVGKPGAGNLSVFLSNPESEVEQFDNKLYLPPSSMNQKKIPSQATTEATIGKPKQTSSASYVVGNSVLMLLQCLFDYDRYFCVFPFLANDVIMRMHDLLKLYDGQCAALILGAGAVDQGAFESISVAHLALSSQCIAFLSNLVGHLYKRLQKLTEGSSVANLTIFQRVQKDLCNHRDEFLLKIVFTFREHVESLEDYPKNKDQWLKGQGMEWIMSMLKNALRLRRNIQPFMVTPESQKLVMLPAYCFLIQKIRTQLHFILGLVGLQAFSSSSSISSVSKINISGMEKIKQKIIDDLLVFKANIEKLGSCVTQAACCNSIGAAAAVASEPPLTDSEQELLAVFFSSSQQQKFPEIKK